MASWGLGAAGLLVCYICVLKGDSVRASDSLRGALDAISRRQRDLYYLHPHSDGDGQPEDIGYGYQKSLVPKTGTVYEAIPMPESELENHDHRGESHFPEGQDLEDLIIDYIEDNIEIDPSKYHYNKNLNFKRSVFRERDIHEVPDHLNNLYVDNDYTNKNYDNGEHSSGLPSPYRGKASSKSPRNYPTQNAQGLVRNFGGLDRDTENYPGNDDDPDEYLSVLNSVWDKYQNSNSDNFDPENLSEQDAEDILSYMNYKEKNQQHENGYDFLSSPISSVKRDRHRLKGNLDQRQYINSLNLLNEPSDKVGLFDEEYMFDDDKDDDEAKLLLGGQIALRNNKRYNKRFWHGNTYNDQHMAVVKRYPIAKRSYYTNPAVLYHKNSADKFNQRRKKNINKHGSEETTDPKVALELSDIFSSPKESNRNKEDENTTASSKLNNDLSSKLSKGEILNESQNHSKISLDLKNNSQANDSKTSKNYYGQKEESGIQFQTKPFGKSKKAINWSNYFGVDKRNKKSMNQPPNDEWLLDQYLKAYSISTREFKDPSAHQKENSHPEINKKNSDDMDAKLRAMEDIIVDQALKYTGAHEGITDSEEVKTVKDRVIAQLAAAYSLEKMRKALSEFKYSIAAQQSSPPPHSHGPTELPEPKNKRVAVKKENANSQERQENKNGDLDNTINVFNIPEHYHPTKWNHESSCPILEEVGQQCKVVSNTVGDRSYALLPLCIWDQVCSLCGPEMGELASGCDVNLISAANKMCADSGRCRYMVHRAMAAVRSVRVPRTCDWEAHPCLARYLASTKR